MTSRRTAIPVGGVSQPNSSDNWPGRLISDYMDDAVERFPDKTAIVGFNSLSNKAIQITYSDLRQKSDRVALGLFSSGIRRGDVVSCQLPNWWQFTALYLGCARIGAIMNPLMPIFRERELGYMLKLADSKALIIPRPFPKVDHVAMVDKIRDDLPSLEQVIIIEGEGASSFEERFVDQDWERQVDAAAIFADHRPDVNDVTELLFTSGTTGEPKGVLHTPNTLHSNVEQHAKVIGLTDQDVIFQSGPIAHQAGFLHGVLMPIMLGATVVLQDVWDPLTAIRTIEKQAVTYTMVVPSILSDIVDHKNLADYDVGSLQTVVTAGSTVTVALVRRAVTRLKCNILPAWGMTEMGTATLTPPSVAANSEHISDGAPLPGVSLRIVDDENSPVPHDQEGRLMAKGTTQFVGYLKRPDLDYIGADGWFDTGDLASMDADGFIRITGRKKDIIIRGGENIPVVEIENQLAHHPAIQSVAIVAMPDPRLGERSCAFVKLNEGSELRFEEMVAYLYDNGTAKNYLPERLEIVDELPRNASGKVLKFELRNIAAGFARNS